MTRRELIEGIVEGRLDPIGELMEHERKYAAALREIRRINRRVLGVFRWRYWRDRAQAWVIRRLDRWDSRTPEERKAAIAMIKFRTMAAAAKYIDPDLLGEAAADDVRPEAG